MDKMEQLEFESIIQPILEIDEYLKLKEMRHHGITRFDHCERVAKFTYRFTKFFHLNYNEATFAAMLHDFFTTEVKKVNVYSKMARHPKIAVDNSSKYFELSDLEKDIILTHMFPVTVKPPKYLESWIVDFIDDVVALYEWGYSFRKEAIAVTTFLIHFIQIR